MRLYEIKVKHCAPKDHHTSTECYIVADSEEQVYNWISTETCSGWDDKADDNKIFDVYDDYNIIGTETFKEKMIRIKGDINDEDYDYSNAYYGITLYGWIEIAAINSDELKVLEQLKIVKKVIE